MKIEGLVLSLVAVPIWSLKQPCTETVAKCGSKLSVNPENRIRTLNRTCIASSSTMPRSLIIVARESAFLCSALMVKRTTSLDIFCPLNAFLDLILIFQASMTSKSSAKPSVIIFIA